MKGALNDWTFSCPVSSLSAAHPSTCRPPQSRQTTTRIKIIPLAQRRVSHGHSADDGPADTAGCRIHPCDARRADGESALRVILHLSVRCAYPGAWIARGRDDQIVFWDLPCRLLLAPTAWSKLFPQQCHDAARPSLWHLDVRDACTTAEQPWNLLTR